MSYWDDLLSKFAQGGVDAGSMETPPTPGMTLYQTPSSVPDPPPVSMHLGGSPPLIQKTPLNPTLNTPFPPPTRVDTVPSDVPSYTGPTGSFGTGGLPISPPYLPAGSYGGGTVAPPAIAAGSAGGALAAPVAPPVAAAPPAAAAPQPYIAMPWRRPIADKQTLGKLTPAKTKPNLGYGIPQPDSPFTMVLRPNAPANYGGRGGGGPALTTALDLSGYHPQGALARGVFP